MSERLDEAVIWLPLLTGLLGFVLVSAVLYLGGANLRQFWRKPPPPKAKVDIDYKHLAMRDRWGNIVTRGQRRE